MRENMNRTNKFLNSNLRKLIMQSEHLWPLTRDKRHIDMPAIEKMGLRAVLDHLCENGIIDETRKRLMLEND